MEQPFLLPIDGRLSRYRHYFAGHNHYERTVFAALAELHFTINEGKQRMVLAHTHVSAGVVLGTALTHDDVASYQRLAAENFNAETFRMRFTAVIGRADTFLVSHSVERLANSS